MLLLALAPPGTPRALAATPGTPRIVSIAVEGARRTRRETVLLLARLREGDPWRDGCADAARQELVNAGIFYEVAVTAEPADGGVRVRIALREKWTFVPVPLFVARDGETTWGATFLESNLFGTASRLVAVLTVREGRPGGTLVYADPHLGGTRFQLFGLLSHADARQGVFDAEREVGSYRRRASGAVAALGWRVAPRTAISLGLRLTDFAFADPDPGVAPPADASERAVSLQLRHEGTDLDEERRRGLFVETRLESGASPLGDDLGRTAASATVRRAFDAGGDTLTVAAHALWTDAADYEAGSRPAAAFLRGYDEDRFRPDRLLGGTIEYQRPVARFREATLSLVPFAGAALLRDRFHAFAAADLQADAGLVLAVYLRRVAFPVLQFYGAYGFSSGEILPGFSLGLGF